MGGKPASPGETVAFLLSQLGFRSSAEFAARLEPLGVDPVHVGMLRIIAAAEGPSQQALSSSLGIPASRMVALVDDLERKGLVERRVNASDRRARALHLTAKGRRVAEQVRTVGLAHEAAVCAPLDDAERDQLLGLLRRVADALGIQREVHPALTRRA
jgi:DNA-binding MarR family transcriptional regulator